MTSGAIGSLLGTVVARSGGIVDIWFARVGAHAHELDRLGGDYLSSEERGRLPDYRVRESAERYVVTRALVRVVLGEHLGMRPRDIEVTRTDMGKPVVSHGIHFNVSHSGDLVLLAVCETRAVGVDVERRREVARVDALVRRWLTHAEHDEIRRLMHDGEGLSMSDAFLRVWSIKEARLKALGVGISGASKAAVHELEALPLDDLLDARTHPASEPGYVGAVALV